MRLFSLYLNTQDIKWIRVFCFSFYSRFEEVVGRDTSPLKIKISIVIFGKALGGFALDRFLM